MLPVERRNLIIGKLKMEKMVYVAPLAKEFDVSEETIRRDLERLDREGIATKSYGGATIRESKALDLPFNVRRSHHVTEKQIIGALVANMVEEGDHLFLDASSTAVYVASAIKNLDLPELTVVTNSIENLMELSGRPEWTILSTGGRLADRYLALFGPTACEGIRSFHADKAFISCKGVSPELGVMEGSEEVMQTKRAMIAGTTEVWLTVDSSKFGQAAFSKVCSLDKITGIISDRYPPEHFAEQCQAMGVQIVWPGAGKELSA